MNMTNGLLIYGEIFAQLLIYSQKKELLGLSPNFHIHVSVSDLNSTTIGLPILLQENMWTDPWEYINRSHTHEW